MLAAILPRDGASGICRVIALDARRDGGTLRVGLLLCDGAIPAGEYPARFFPDENTESPLTVRLPDLQDAAYEQIELEIIHGE